MYKKVCNECGRVVFTKRKKSGRLGICRWCAQKRCYSGTTGKFKTHCIRGHEFTDDNVYRASDGHRVCIKCKHERKESPAQIKEKWLRRYGLSVERYDTMVKDQNGICGLCKRWFAKLVIDHNHTTTVVRELLCRKCNLALGHFDDNLDRLRLAVEYLTKHSA